MPTDPLADLFAQGVPYVAVGVTLLVSLLKPVLEDTVPLFSPKNATLHDAALRILVFVLNVVGVAGWYAWAGRFAWVDGFGYLLLGVSLTIGSLGTYHLVTSGGQSIATAGYSLAATVANAFKDPAPPMAPPSEADPGGMVPPSGDLTP